MVSTSAVADPFQQSELGSIEYTYNSIIGHLEIFSKCSIPKDGIIDRLLIDSIQEELTDVLEHGLTDTLNSALGGYLCYKGIERPERRGLLREIRLELLDLLDSIRLANLRGLTYIEWLSSSVFMVRWMEGSDNVGL